MHEQRGGGDFAYKAQWLQTLPDCHHLGVFAGMAIWSAWGAGLHLGAAAKHNSPFTFIVLQL